MHPQQNLVVQPQPKRDNFLVDDPDFLMKLRRSLRQMLVVVEEKLGIPRNKCRKCGHVLSD